MDDHRGPWYHCLPVVAGLFFPLSLFLPAGLLLTSRLERPFRLRNEPLGTAEERPDPLVDLNLLCALSFAITLLLFSLATTRLPGDILPPNPPAAVLVTLTLVPASQPGGTVWKLGLTAWLNLVVLALEAAATAPAPRWLILNPLFPDLNRTLITMVQGLAAPFLTATLLVLLMRFLPARRSPVAPRPSAPTSRSPWRRWPGGLLPLPGRTNASRWWGPCPTARSSMAAARCASPFQ